MKLSVDQSALWHLLVATEENMEISEPSNRTEKQKSLEFVS